MKQRISDPRVRGGNDPHAVTVVRERLALVVLAAVASARAMVAIAPALRFDSDPAIVPGAFAGIGPSASLLLDALGVAAIAFLAAARLRASRLESGRAIGASTALLLLLPLPALLLLTLAPSGGFADLWRGATWLVAALAAAMVAGTDRAGRAVVIGALVGAVAAMVVRGASQVLIEHPAMVAEFERSRDAFLASRGWTPGSAAALAYERRLRQPEASGWFGLANVHSGIMVSAFFLLAALAWATRPTRKSVTAGGALCAMVALGALATVIVNGSKGALFVLAIGVVVFALLMRMARAPDARRQRWVPRTLACLVLLAPLAAFVRGGLLGETAMAERSLLFRWQYLIGSLRMFVAEPLTGVGVGGFQDAYTLRRPWFSPEEVVSAHAAFVDWIAVFGIGGVGVIALAMVLLVRSLRAPWRCDMAPSALSTPSTPPGPPTGLLAAISAGTGGALAMSLTASTDLNADSLVIRAAALFIAIGTSLLVAHIVERATPEDERIIGVGTAVAALVLVVHAQVDMTFWLPGSVWWCWLLLGIAAAAARPAARRLDRPALAIVGTAAMLAAFVLGIMSVRAGVQERTAERAALAIEAAARSGQAPPRYPAAQLLAQATTVIPGNTVIWQAAIDQALMSIDEIPKQETGARLARLRETRDLAEQAVAARPESLTLRLLADVRLREAIEWRRDRNGTIVPGPDINDPEADRALIQAIDAVLARDPRSLTMWRRRVETQLLLGDTAGAAASAKRAIEVDASFALDPLRRLSDREREALERINASPSTDAAPRPR